jgi:hypothetical protein
MPPGGWQSSRHDCDSQQRTPAIRPAEGEPAGSYGVLVFRTRISSLIGRQEEHPQSELRSDTIPGPAPPLTCQTNPCSRARKWRVAVPLPARSSHHRPPARAVRPARPGALTTRTRSCAALPLAERQKCPSCLPGSPSRFRRWPSLMECPGWAALLTVPTPVVDALSPKDEQHMTILVMLLMTTAAPGADPVAQPSSWSSPGDEGPGAGENRRWFSRRRVLFGRRSQGPQQQPESAWGAPPSGAFQQVPIAAGPITPPVMSQGPQQRPGCACGVRPAPVAVSGAPIAPGPMTPPVMPQGAQQQPGWAWGAPPGGAFQQVPIAAGSITPPVMPQGPQQQRGCACGVRPSRVAVNGAPIAPGPMTPPVMPQGAQQQPGWAWGAPPGGAFQPMPIAAGPITRPVMPQGPQQQPGGAAGVPPGGAGRLVPVPVSGTPIAAGPITPPVKTSEPPMAGTIGPAPTTLPQETPSAGTVTFPVSRTGPSPAMRRPEATMAPAPASGLQRMPVGPAGSY